MPFAAPGPYLPQKRSRPSKKTKVEGHKEGEQHPASPALLRLRIKLAKGQINTVERQVLRMLEQQSAAEVKTALAAKAAMKAAAQKSDDTPLTDAQARARFLCRAQQAELVKAKARTQYVPLGPPAEGDDEKNSPSHKKRQYAQEMDNNWQFWNSYFQKMPTAAAKNAVAETQRQRQQAKRAAQCPDSEDNIDDNSDDPYCSDSDLCHEDSSRSYDHDPLSDSDCNSYSDNDCGTYGVGPVQRSEECATQQAFKKLVLFVQQLPESIAKGPAAARLKAFPSLKVINKQALASAARQIWLVVHPDKVHGRDAQMASQEFGKLLGTLKEKGSL